MHRCVLLIFALLFSADVALGLEIVRVKRDDREFTVSGRILAEADDGGLLLQSTDGVIWRLPPEEQVKREQDSTPFVPLSQAELGEKLKSELPAGFEIHATKNYLICHNTSKAYAQWCGSLFERLHLAFNNFWSRKGFDLKKPEFPLVAVVFADKASYARYARGELGDAVDAIIGYYNFDTNRMTMYDLTGSEALRRPGDRGSTAAQINTILQRPDAMRTVATIVHEATHQIAFNCGLQTRCSDIPLWVSEGLAMYFETPDLQSATGWRGIGALNHARLNMFRDYVTRRPAGSLKSLIMDDSRIRDPKTAGDSYAEAWALNYFLVNQRPKQYLEYFKLLALKQPQVQDEPETRLQEFQQIFGENLQQLDAEFVRYMLKAR